MSAYYIAMALFFGTGVFLSVYVTVHSYTLAFVLAAITGPIFLAMNKEE